jgi:hypothetical protein
MKRTQLISWLAVIGCTVLPLRAIAAPQGAPPPAGATAATPSPPPAPIPPAPTPPSTEYKSEATQAWGAAAVPADPQKEELKKRCAAAGKEGKNLPECKQLELDIVFQGGMGSKRVAAPVLPQASDTESKQLVEKKLAIEAEEKEAEEIASGKMDLWAVARRERPLLEESRPRFFAAGLRVGYPFLVARGSGLKEGYKPLIHAAIEGSFQALRFVQLALVADFQALRGRSSLEEEFLPEARVVYEDGTPRPLRDVAALLDDFYGAGVRPTVRLNAEWRSIMASLGLGFGWHFFHASGRWRVKLDATDRANTDPLYSPAAWQGSDYAVFSFEENDNGAYAVFEFALMYRLLEDRIGLGLMLDYTILLHAKTDPEITIEEQYGLDDALNNPAGLEGYHAVANDYEETLVRHLAAMNFLTFGLVADYRF